MVLLFSENPKMISENTANADSNLHFFGSVLSGHYDLFLPSNAIISDSVACLERNDNQIIGFCRCLQAVTYSPFFLL